jgi:hypothetical protein
LRFGCGGSAHARFLDRTAHVTVVERSAVGAIVAALVDAAIVEDALPLDVGFDGRPHCKRRRRVGTLALARRRHYQKLREAL